MDEGEHDGAYAFDADYDVLVFLYTLHVAFKSFECPSDDPHPLAALKVCLAVDLAAGGVVGGEELQQAHLVKGYSLNAVSFLIAVDPEHRHGVGFFPSLGFEAEGDAAPGADKDHMRNQRQLPGLSAARGP